MKLSLTILSLISTISTVSAFSVNHNILPTPTALYSTTAEGTTSETATPAAAVEAPKPAAVEAAAVEAPVTPAAPKPAGVESNQPKYGKELELPGTYVRCGRCATSFALAVDDLGTGRGCRVECSLCSHSWFQTRDRLFTLNDGHELIPLPQTQIDRIASNISKNRDPDYIGDTKFFVGNLDFGVTEKDIREMFAAIGEVGDVSLVMGPDGRSRGFAFVTMMDAEDEAKCLELDGKDLNGRNINVKIPN